MRLLIVTQVLDFSDPVLGFFGRWVEEFSKHCEKVIVIAGSVGEYNLPANVEVHSFGKEKVRGSLVSRWKSGFLKCKRVWKFWEFFSEHYARSDAVFFHMIPEFVLAASPFLISLRKPSALWYVHKSVTRKLKLAERLVDWVFSASELSFRLPSKKVVYTGHAIDIDTFAPNSKFQISNSKTVRLLTVGRISPVKDLETVLRACLILKNTFSRGWILSIVGGPAMPRDAEYLETLKKFIAENGLSDRVSFYGARPYTEIPEIYREHDIFISMSTTGSMDKAVLEAMSCGLTVITANEAFQGLLPPQYFLEKRSPEFLAERIKALADEPRPNLSLRDAVINHHSLLKTINKIYGILSSGL